MMRYFSRSSQRKTSVFLPLGAVVLIVLMGIGFWAAPAHADDPGYVISIQFENDFFGGGTDRHFSHGTRIECLTGHPWTSMLQISSRGSGLKGRGPARETNLTHGRVFRSGRTCTPLRILPQRSSLRTTGPMRVGFIWDSDWWPTREINVTTSLNLKSAWSGLPFAEDVQTFWNSLLGLQVPNGWDHQLENEPGAVLYYEQTRRFESRTLDGVWMLMCFPILAGHWGMCSPMGLRASHSGSARNSR